MKTVSIDIPRTLDALYAGKHVEVFNAAGGLVTFHDVVPAHEVRELLARVNFEKFGHEMFDTVGDAMTADAMTIAAQDDEIASLRQELERLENTLASYRYGEEPAPCTPNPA